MARSAIECNKAIFDRLKTHAAEKTNSPIGAEISKTNYYIRSNADSKEWIINGNLDAPIYLPNKIIATKISLNSHQLFVVVSEDKFESVNPTDFAHIDQCFTDDQMNFPDFEGGLWTLILAELKIEPSIASGYEILQILITDEKANAIGISVDALKLFFPKIQIFYISENSIYSSFDTTQLFLALTLQNPNKLTLNWNKNAIDSFEDTLTVPHDEYPYYCLINSLYSARWELAFLEIYKQLEFLYSIPQAAELKRLIQSQISVLDIAKHVEDSLSWRASEEPSLAHLFSLLPQGIHDDIVNATANLAPFSAVKPNAAARIYKIRNSVVHLRPAVRPIEIDEDSWNLLNQELCKASINLYRQLL
ncbi:hypothetical protein UNDKW_3289 [Undibacterium sp. KW1]|uniref:hypothetical protein n=1 Tax=Undibacterium sp. KW1 TaxID=2058624 RepID=UPI001331F0FA|nr:hypothetical protein [Undibacterium sp. KW1]BBB61562.1 hypothetical protein UNDKW_3289 [Undibacterium sp. KW1]